MPERVNAGAASKQYAFPEWAKRRIRERDGDACWVCGDSVDWSAERNAPNGGEYDHEPPARLLAERPDWTTAFWADPAPWGRVICRWCNHPSRHPVKLAVRAGDSWTRAMAREDAAWLRDTAEQMMRSEPTIAAELLAEVEGEESRAAEVGAALQMWEDVLRGLVTVAQWVDRFPQLVEWSKGRAVRPLLRLAGWRPDPWEGGLWGLYATRTHTDSRLRWAA